MTKPERTFPLLYGSYFLLLAVAWLSVPESWRTAVFLVTYASASAAITILGTLIDRRETAANDPSE